MIIAQSPGKTSAKQPVKAQTKPKVIPEVKIEPYVADSIRMARATPGEMHQVLFQLIGAWHGDVSFYSETEREPLISSVQVFYESQLENRFFTIKLIGEVNRIGMEGLGTLGYDNTRKLFIGTWIDNNHTGMISLEGRWEEDRKLISLRGKRFDPVNGKEKAIKVNLTLVDDFNHTLEVYSIDGSAEMKVTTINFRRN
jgi:hypothetical protein